MQQNSVDFCVNKACSYKIINQIHNSVDYFDTSLEEEPNGSLFFERSTPLINNLLPTEIATTFHRGVMALWYQNEDG